MKILFLPYFIRKRLAMFYVEQRKFLIQGSRFRWFYQTGFDKIKPLLGAQQQQHKKQLRAD